MAYNPYSAVNAIYNYKGQWDKANSENDEKTKKEAEKNAKNYYKQLRNNGYESVADELAASNYTQAKSINDKWAKKNRTPTRDYLYTLGKSYGLNSSEMDNLISWDNQTGEVSLGGKKIGTPDAVVDGVSYWDDTKALDNAFSDYVNRSGTTRTKTAAVNQENENLFQRYAKEYEDLKSTNPYETDEAKSILAKYDLAGLQGRDNEVASSAGSNGGNIDSFAAANALRQQASLLNQGQQAVREAYQQKLDHARNLLSDMGVNIDRVYTQDETSKNNDVARKSEIASVTGYTPSEWSIQTDEFLKNFVDEDGKLKAEYKNVDFQELINNAKESGNTELANKYAILRGKKILEDFDKYGKYLNEGDIAYLTPQKTETAREFDEQIAASDRALANELNIANTEAQASNYKADMDYQKGIDVANTNGIWDMEKQNLANEGNANVQYIKNAGNLAVQQSKNSSSGKSSSGSSSKTSGSGNNSDVTEASKNLETFFKKFNKEVGDGITPIIYNPDSGILNWNVNVSEDTKKNCYSELKNYLENDISIGDEYKQAILSGLKPAGIL